jgi:histone deacetylase 1/2
LLQTKFALKDIGELSLFLGIEAIKSINGLYLSQRHYILDLLILSNMDKAKSCLTLMSTSQSLTKSDGIPFHDPYMYLSVIKGLQYLSFTWLDVAFAVHKVSKYMYLPLEPHWTAVKRILCY